MDKDDKEDIGSTSGSASGSKRGVTIEPEPLAALPAQPLKPLPTLEPRWQFWRKPEVRDFSEQYKAPRWWQRLFSLMSLGVISLTIGVMVAVAIAAAIAAAAIALQSLIS